MLSVLPDSGGGWKRREAVLLGRKYFAVKCESEIVVAADWMTHAPCDVFLFLLGGLKKKKSVLSVDYRL